MLHFLAPICTLLVPLNTVLAIFFLNDIDSTYTTKQTQKKCITFTQCWVDVYKWYTNVLCFLGRMYACIL